MATKTYEELYDEIQALCGVTFAPVESKRIRSFVNRRAYRAYRASKFWPNYLVIGEKISMMNGNVDKNSSNQYLIVKGQKYIITSYVSGEDFTSIGASSNATGIVFTSTFTGAIGYASTLNQQSNSLPLNLTGIDTLIKVHKEQPYLSKFVQDFDFFIGNGFVNLIASPLNPAYAWFTYQLNFPSSFGPSSPSDPAYNTNDINNVDAEWFHYISYGVYADYLRSEGQQEKAIVADQEADIILQDEMIRLDEQKTTGFIGTKISTNTNHQLR